MNEVSDILIGYTLDKTNRAVLRSTQSLLSQSEIDSASKLSALSFVFGYCVGNILKQMPSVEDVDLEDCFDQFKEGLQLTNDKTIGKAVWK